MKLLTLFFSFLQIGAFSFGGGYAALPLIQYQVVDYSSDIGMHFTFMYYCIADCLYLFKISANVNYSKYFKIYSSGCSVADCSFRTIDYC